MKKLKPTKAVHTSMSTKGMGDYYGTGIKQKQGRIRDDYMGTISMTPKALKKPPRSLA
jgi:hypothetical protein